MKHAAVHSDPASVLLHLRELRHRVEEALLVFFHRSEEVVLHLEAVVFQLGVAALELAHELLVLLHLARKA